MSLRTLRRWITGNAVVAGQAMAPAMPGVAIDLFEWSLAHAAPITPVIALLVRSNMRAAGVYSSSAFKAYFAQIALHLANGMRVFKWAGQPERVAELARTQIRLDDSIDRLQASTDLRHGAILAPAHTSNYVLTLARLAQSIPVSIYLRWSDDRRKLELKRKWCEAAGLGVIMEPASASDPTSRAAACIEALRAGTILAMTPDIAQKGVEGTPVRFLDRTIRLPTGTASIAMLAEAPMIPLFGRIERGVQTLYVETPITVAMMNREQGGRKAAVQLAMQQWTDGFERFIRQCPAAWFLWGDNRWTRVFRNDPRYATPIPTK